MSAPDGAVLVTGATGLVGAQVMARYLELTDRHVFALVRADDAGAAERRLRATIASVYGDEHAHHDRVTAVPGDIERPQLGLSASLAAELAGAVTDVVHAAASVAFSLPLARAREINVTGTERVLELAARCTGLRSVSYVSTTYVAGAYDGHFAESDLDVGQAFRNSYERSKFEAELLVREWAARLPIRVFRPGIIVGESVSGWTPSFNVLYYPIRLFAKGVNPPIVPARPDTPIDAVPIDFVADAIFALAGESPGSAPVVHLVAGRDAGTIGELLTSSARHFGRRPPLLIPLRLYMLTLNPILSRIYRGARKRQIDRGAEFLPYFSMRQTFDDSASRELLTPTGLAAPAIGGYFERLLDYAVRSEWGRRPLSRDAARALHAQAVAVR